MGVWVCVGGRSVVGWCQPGQFKGRSLLVRRRGQPVVAQAERAVMTAPSETYDVIVVGGGISGGWKTRSSVLRDAQGRRGVLRRHEQMLVAI